MQLNTNNSLMVHYTPTLEDLEFKENQSENNALKAKLSLQRLRRKLLDIQTLSLEKKYFLNASLKS